MIGARYNVRVLIVVIDTNVCGGVSHAPLDALLPQKLLDATRKGAFRLAVPEVVVREAANKWTDTTFSKVSKLNSAAEKPGWDRWVGSGA